MHQSKFKAGHSKLKVVLVYLLIASCAGASFLVLPGIFSNILPVVIPIILFQPPQIQVPTAVLPFNSNLQSAAITPDGSKLYASDSFNNTVSVIDLSINEVIAILDAGNGPSSIQVTPDGSRDKVVTKVNLGSRPSGLAITPNGSGVYVTGFSLLMGIVSVIDVSNNEV